jgi:Uma2 family endonuclease
MATAPASALMTAEQLADLPDDGNLYELSRGMLVCVSPSSYGPSMVAGRVMARLFPFIEERRLGDYGSAEGGFKLASDPDTVRAPDIWFVRADRTPTPVDRDDFYLGPPDLAVEVLSPSDRFREVMRKVHDYLEARTPLVWVLDPKSKVTAVFRPGQPVRFLDEDGSLDGEDVLPGLVIPLRDIFR